jgi:hypothetical protein
MENLSAALEQTEWNQKKSKVGYCSINVGRGGRIKR